MVRALPMLLIAGVLAGCAGSAAPEAGETEAGPLQLSCYQAGWQAETIQVVYKRGGQEVWDRYDPAPPVGNVGCH